MRSRIWRRCRFQGRQPGVQSRLLRRFGIFFEKDRSLIDVGAVYPANDYEGRNFFGGFRAIF
ncbi:MAG: hypothetical protein DLM68_09800 [Hyphomicrobiales bacterium]|nr:MAG: hypothetical protein DLM68_09800 [Hyphomicrobiales bacterium]